MSRARNLADYVSTGVTAAEFDFLDTTSGTPGSGTFLRGDKTWQGAGFGSGTKMIFHQTAAPTGWTKLTTTGTGSTAINDVGLRIVSGTITDGVAGSVAFDTAFASQGIADHTLATSEMPSHTHTIPRKTNDTDQTYFYDPNNSFDAATYTTFDAPPITSSTGGGSGHNHGAIDLNVKYIDLILASKD